MNITTRNRKFSSKILVVNPRKGRFWSEKCNSPKIGAKLISNSPFWWGLFQTFLFVKHFSARKADFSWTIQDSDAHQTQNNIQHEAKGKNVEIIWKTRTE